MAKLANISGRQAVQAFKRIGYQFVRQEGSHMILSHPKPGYPTRLTVSDKSLPQGQVELTPRATKESQLIPLTAVEKSLAGSNV